MTHHTQIVRVCMLIGVLIVAGSRIPIATAGCPGSGDCCAIHSTPGCNDFDCCNEVCAFDEFCCFLPWDSSCVSLAEDHCGSLCNASACPGTGDCCQTHGSPGCNDALCCDLVCTRNATCCSGQWSSSCATLATQICDVCEPPIVCPMEGECCTPHVPTPGCNREACCDLVCNLDEFCCRGEWDDVCARKARDHCPNICVCSMFADLDDNGVVNLRDFALFQNCFTSSSSVIGDECACADYDADDRVTLPDFKAFLDALTGP